MPARSESDADLTIVFLGLGLGALTAFTLGSSVAVGTVVGGALAQAVVVLRRRAQGPRSA